MGFLKGYTKQEISWMMYDWANSAHSVIVVTILPIFFDSVADYTRGQCVQHVHLGLRHQHRHGRSWRCRRRFLGVFGDIRGMRKKLFSRFSGAGGVWPCAGLALTPGHGLYLLHRRAAGRVAGMVLVLYILSTIGFDASCIYYDAFLTDITTEDRMDSRLHAWATVWAISAVPPSRC